jgi:hypothetical protein
MVNILTGFNNCNTHYKEVYTRNKERGTVKCHTTPSITTPSIKIPSITTLRITTRFLIKRDTQHNDTNIMALGTE